MPAMWLDVNTVLAEVPVNILQLIDDGDFKAREEGVTYDQAGMDLIWEFTTTGGVTTQTAVTPTTGGGDYDWTIQGNGMYTIGMPATGGISIDNDAEGFGHFIGFATGVLPWRGPIIGFRAAALNNALIDGSVAPAVAGDLMALVADAITSAKYDETTAFPVKADDAAATQIARVGADGDTLETLSDQLDTAQADLDNPAQYKADVSALATAANQTTILARLGAWTGSGVNTILGTFKAILSKVAALPSDIGGTGDPTTDSLEAIRERGDAAWDTADVSNVSVDELQASALADMFNTDSGDAYATAVSGSVVKEIADNAGGSALTVSAIVDGVWNALTADHTVAASFGLKLGGILAAIWGYVTRTLTSSAAETVSTVAGTTITITRGDTLTASITGLGSIASRNKLWFTVKTDRGDADTAAIIQIEETLQLVRLNGAAPEVADAANGTITVDNAAEGNITIVLAAVESAKLTLISGIRYDVQYFVTATGLVTTVTSGLLTVAADVTRATS